MIQKYISLGVFLIGAGFNLVYAENNHANIQTEYQAINEGYTLPIETKAELNSFLKAAENRFKSEI